MRITENQETEPKEQRKKKSSSGKRKLDGDGRTGNMGKRLHEAAGRYVRTVGTWVGDKQGAN